MAVRFLASLILFLVSAGTISAQEALRQDIQKILMLYKGVAGISILNTKTGDTVSVNGHRRFPMQSVFKFPIGLVVLDQVDKRKLSLQQMISVKRADMLQNTWSPLSKKYPQGDFTVTVEELVRLSVSQSDNNACDILLNLIGGARVVETFLRTHGFKGIEIRHTEREMHAAWDVQFANWCDPVTMTLILKKFSDGKMLSPASTALLNEMLVSTTTGPKRLKGLLPGVLIAHKTGTSGINDHGMMAAVHDVGAITLPDGALLIVTTFLTGTTEPMATSEQIIARVAETAYKYHSRP